MTGHFRRLFSRARRFVLSILSSKVLWLHVAFFIGLTVGALHGFLFRPGLVIFQNWIWPIDSDHILPVGAAFSPYIWTNSGIDPAAYTRSLTNWPVFALTVFKPSTELLERLYVVYAFGIDYVLAFVAATFLQRLLVSVRSSLSSEYFRVTVIVLFLINPAALQWESGLLMGLFWGAPLLLAIGLSAILAVRQQKLAYAVIAGLGLGWGATLDPRLAIWGGGIVGVALFLELLGNAGLKRVLTTLGAIAAAALPGIGLTLFAYGYGAGAVSLRTASIESLTVFSSNASLPQTFNLLGYYITGIFYAPPSITVAGSPGTLPSFGNPAFMLLPPDFITPIWRISLVALPVLAFSGLLIRRFRPVSLFLALTALVGLAFASGSNPPFLWLAQAEVHIGSALPGLLSSVWQTTVGVPIYVQVVTEAMYVPLAALTVSAVFDRIKKVGVGNPQAKPSSTGPPNRLPKRWRTHAVKRIPGVVAFAVVAVVVFGSWQYFTGNFYPGGLSPGVSSNEASSLGALQPTSVPSSDIAIYNYLVNNGGSNGVYWPGANSYSYPWNQRWSSSVLSNSPLPLRTPVGLTEVVSDNLTFDTAPLLATFGVRYVVVDNMSFEALQLAFGLGSLNAVLDFFSWSAGISLLMSFPPDSWLFESNLTNTSVSAATNAAQIAAQDESIGQIVGAMSSLRLPLAFGPSGGSTPTVSLGFPNASDVAPSIRVITPETLAPLLFRPAVYGFSQPLTNPQSFSVNKTGEFEIPYPYSNWTLSVWKLSEGTVYVNATPSGSLALNATSGSSLISINYLSSLVNGKRDGIPVDPSAVVEFNVSADIRAVFGAAGSAYLNTVSSNASLVNVAQLSTASTALSANWTNLSLAGILPLGSAFFTLRVFLSGSIRSVVLRDVSIEYVELPIAPASFAGNLVDITNQTMEFPIGEAPTNFTFAFEAKGNAVVNLTCSDVSRLDYVRNTALNWTIVRNIVSGSELRFSTNGDLSLAGIVILPAVVRLPPLNAILTVRPGPLFGYVGSLSFAASGFIELRLPYLADWRLTLGSGRVILPEPGSLGDVFFSVPAGNNTFTISIVGITTLPLILVGVGLFYGAMGAILVLTLKRGALFLRRRHRLPL